MALLDQTGDNSQVKLFQLAQLYGMPDYVKSASVEDTGLAMPGSSNYGSSLPLSVYADPRTPAQFPCHTKAATYMSYAYFLDAKPQLSKDAAIIESRFAKFAEYWGLKLDFQRLRNKVASVQSSLAMPETRDCDFAMVFVENGEKVRAFPVRNAMETKAAADWFSKYRDHFPFEIRKDFAAKLIEKSAQYGASLNGHDDMIERQAGRGFCRPKEAADLLRSRLKLVGNRLDADRHVEVEKLASQVESKPFLAMTYENLTKIASIVDSIDRSTNVQYSDITKRPEDVLFQVTYKEASDYGRHSVTTQTGSVYDSRDFEKLSLADLRSLFGDEFVRGVSSGLRIDPVKMAEVAATLPRPDAQLLDRLLGDANVYPVKKASVANYDLEALNKMAEYYEAGCR